MISEFVHLPLLCGSGLWWESPKVPAWLFFVCWSWQVNSEKWTTHYLPSLAFWSCL